MVRGLRWRLCLDQRILGVGEVAQSTGRMAVSLLTDGATVISQAVSDGVKTLG